MQEVKHIKFLEVSFNTAICVLKFTVSSVSAKFLNAQAEEASKFIQYFNELHKKKLTTFVSPKISSDGYQLQKMVSRFGNDNLL
jgi:hypothetical protein